MALASWPPGATTQDDRGPIGDAAAHDAPPQRSRQLGCTAWGCKIIPHYSESSNIIKPGIPSLVVVALAGLADSTVDQPHHLIYTHVDMQLARCLSGFPMALMHRR